MLSALVVLVLASAGTATWFGTRAVQLQRELEQQSVLLDRSVARLGEREEVLSTLIDADGELAVTHLVDDSTSAGITVYWNRKDGRSVLSGFGLPPLPRERVYALWMGDSIQMRIATTFNADVKGRVLSKQFMIPPTLSAPLLLRLTVELANPGQVPSMNPLLTGVLQADSMKDPPR